MKKVIAIFCFLSSVTILAQKKENQQNEMELQKIENRLVYYFDKVNYFRFDSLGQLEVNSTDSIENYNYFLLMEFVNALKLDERMEFQFRKLKSFMKILGSADKKLRVFSWNTMMGGTEEWYNAVLQYRTDSGCKIKYKNWRDSSQEYFSFPIYKDLFTFPTLRDTLYLAIYHYKMMNTLLAQGVCAFKVENGELYDDERIFNTGKRKMNSIDFEYNSNSTNTMNLILFDEKSKTIKVPVVTKEGKVTSKYLNYSWDGQFFTYTRKKK